MVYDFTFGQIKKKQCRLLHRQRLWRALMNLTSRRTICLSDDVVLSFHCCSVQNRTGQCGGCCIHTGSLQHVECLSQYRRYSRSVLIFAVEERKCGCEISPCRTAPHFFHLLQIQDRPRLPKHPWRTHLTEESLAWFQLAAATGICLFQTTLQKHVQCEVHKSRDPAVHVC